MTPPPSSLHYTVGPIVALVVVLLIIVFLRWAFNQGPQHDPFATAEPTGLLQAVATVPDRPKALALRAVLSDAGIRSTVREVSGRGAEVLVFPADVDRARELAGPYATPG